MTGIFQEMWWTDKDYNYLVLPPWWLPRKESYKFLVIFLIDGVSSIDVGFWYLFAVNMRRFVHLRWKNFVTLLITRTSKTRFGFEFIWGFRLTVYVCIWGHLKQNYPMQVLQMESAVLNFLKFEMTAPTVKCFLRYCSL